MSQGGHEKRIDYIEFQAGDLARAKAFYAAVFGWEFKDWGDAYASFDDGRMRGGFQQVETVRPGGALIVFYARDLEVLKSAVLAAGGAITREIFEFPGGHRFHFADSEGNELAIWSDA